MPVVHPKISIMGTAVPGARYKKPLSSDCRLLAELSPSSLPRYSVAMQGPLVDAELAKHF